MVIFDQKMTFFCLHVCTVCALSTSVINRGSGPYLRNVTLVVGVTSVTSVTRVTRVTRDLVVVVVIFDLDLVGFDLKNEKSDGRLWPHCS